MADWVSDEIYEERLRICRETCFLFEPARQVCKGCGCMMNVKARGRKVRCPLDKWPPGSAES